jgi:di/tricarboxylate transporter
VPLELGSLVPLTSQQLAFFVILALALVLLVTERLPTDAVAVLIILSLVVTGVLSSEDALAGFRSEPAIVIASIFVISAAFQTTGLADLFGRWIGQASGKGLLRMLAIGMPAAAAMSAFTHHVAVTAIMLPVGMNLSRERGVPASKLLMPLAIASSLGTTLTIIGAPSFLVASELLRQAGRPGLSVFSITPLGAALTIAGLAFVLAVGRFLLPTRRGSEEGASRFRLDEYFTELSILPNSPLLGKTLDEVHADKRFDFSVHGWLRGSERLRPPYADGSRRLEAGDVLLIRTTPDELVAIRQEPGLELEPVSRYERQTPELAAADPDDVPERLAQAIVAPESGFAGRTLGEVDFRRRFGALVLGLWRRQGFVAHELARTRLREGDVLVLQGDEEALARVASDRGVLMLVPFEARPRRQGKALIATAIMLGTIVAASTNLTSLGIATVSGATAMVLSRCIAAREAYRSIDARMFVFIAGAIPLGTAMKKSGTADMLASWLQGILANWSETLILLGLFALVGVVVQFMGSDSATTALFGPLAIAVAQALGQPPEAYVMTVAMAAVTAVFTPMSHHNLLIYGPGGYRFFDYFRVGAPLTAVLALVVAFVAPLVWRA